MAEMAVAVSLTGADQVIRDEPALLAGFVVVETGGLLPARIRLYDNASAASGTVVGASSLAANGAETIMLARPVRCDSGIYVDVVTGSVVGSVYVV